MDNKSNKWNEEKNKKWSISQTYARMLYVNHPTLPLTSRMVCYTDDLIMINNLYDIVQYEIKLGKKETHRRLIENIDYGVISVMRKKGVEKRWQVRI